ncbi:sensor histidine kinase [Roseiflexus castenholzii]|uniref:Histidine kinase n=1 Tax=Roseiflexus castenholzii (strain DSM 13941 / HLO8) TaxID=383372 RepID=A7NJK3_ROSCS|nr:sensor histidine kinase [Roseiflexus castenholzii]ABU57673.1 histidine kinase [Roseiflexus castenholzii DSM 13941]
MNSQDGQERSAALREARDIVAEQLEQLRALAEHERQEIATLAAALRQAERELDEVTLQYRTAVQRRRSGAESLNRRMTELREQCDALSRDVDARRSGLRQIELLIRQIEMSSSALSNTGTGATSDPWALALRSQVIHGREEERMRLAREVHDGPAQVLANSLMLLETCYSLAQQQTGEHAEKLAVMIGRLRDATREGLSEVRRFIANLRPGQVAERGLVEALREYLRAYGNTYNVPVVFEADAAPRQADEVEIVLYRIVQEALQNAHKYARGSPITVRLAYRSDTITLSVRDEGPGFDPREVARRAGKSNWGLTSMRERAELIGARLTVASRPGYGTEVTVVLPLEQTG